MQFRLSADREKFEPGFAPQRSSPDEVLERMLAENDDRLSPETLDPLFKFDIDALKKGAAAEAFNVSPEFA
jgi:hypothetical protein